MNTKLKKARQKLHSINAEIGNREKELAEHVGLAREYHEKIAELQAKAQSIIAITQNARPRASFKNWALWVAGPIVTGVLSLSLLDGESPIRAVWVLAVYYLIILGPAIHELVFMALKAKELEIATTINEL